MEKTCKICNKIIENKRTYCSNECKYSDPELNAKRARTEKNDPNFHVKCKLCGWISKDEKNISGNLSKHLESKHVINTTNFTDYFDKIPAPQIEYWKCPMCNWKSKDIINKSGWITTHIQSHNISENDFYNQYPHLKIQTDKLTKRELAPHKTIECKICGKKMLSMSRSHAEMHGTTVKEYKEKYEFCTISV